VWFVGLHECLLGDRNQLFAALADRAVAGFAAAILLAAACYVISYKRYRTLLLESPAELSVPRVRQWNIVRLPARKPRQEALMQFMCTTMARSHLHRLMAAAYAGVTAAIVLNSSLLASSALKWSAGWLAALQFAALFWPIAMSVITIPGFRHILATPIELRANWIFQISESQCRADWMAAVERFVIAFAIAPIYLLISSDFNRFSGMGAGRAYDHAAGASDNGDLRDAVLQLAAASVCVLLYARQTHADGRPWRLHRGPDVRSARVVDPDCHSGTDAGDLLRGRCCFDGRLALDARTAPRRLGRIEAALRGLASGRYGSRSARLTEMRTVSS
jgi:hypothetical protein